MKCSYYCSRGKKKEEMSRFSVLSECISTHFCSFNKPTASCPGGPSRVYFQSFSHLGSKFGYLSGSLLLSPSSCEHRSKTRIINCCNRKVASKFSRINDEKKFRSRRRSFSLRLRPRVRLLLWRLQRLSTKTSLEKSKLLIFRNLRIVVLTTSISLVLVLCAMFLKFTAVPSPKIVPYSELITDLQEGYVSKVLFEEGSRRIFYNKHSLTADSETIPSDEERSGSLSRWALSTRKIDHDENFLLGLMRDKGVVYSSAPQSALMAIRGLVITILSLWIPLTPLMWLLYRQISAANSPAKKRRPTTQMVDFDDVEGVDSAKAELLEVCIQSGTEIILNISIPQIIAFFLWNVVGK